MSWYLDVIARNNDHAAELQSKLAQRDERRTRVAAMRGAPAGALPLMPVRPQENAMVTLKRRRRRLRAASPKPPKISISTEMLGRGAFGCVMMGMNEENGQLLAVKVVDIPSQQRSEDTTVADLVNEIKLMKKLEHPNIVKYVHADREERKLRIYMEYMPGGSLASLQKKFNTFSDSLVRHYMTQTLAGLSYLHSKQIVHRDLKADNILMTSNGEVKLSDFGTGKELTESLNLNSVKGTPWFMAPEVIRGTGHHTAADIWSLGCTMLQLHIGKPPFHDHANSVTAMFLIATEPAKAVEYVPDGINPTAADMIKRCLCEDPSMRPSAVELLSHPFLTSKEDDDDMTTTTGSEFTLAETETASQAAAAAAAAAGVTPAVGTPLPAQPPVALGGVGVPLGGQRRSSKTEELRRITTEARPDVPPPAKQ